MDLGAIRDRAAGMQVPGPFGVDELVEAATLVDPPLGGLRVRSAAALARWAWSLSSRKLSFCADASRERWAPGLTLAASTITAPCCAETAPSTSASRTTGSAGSALESSSSERAAASDMPPAAARYSAGEAKPSPFQRWLSSTRRATSALAAAIWRPITSSSRHSAGACEAGRASGSSRRTRPASASRWATTS